MEVLLIERSDYKFTPCLKLCDINLPLFFGKCAQCQPRSDQSFNIWRPTGTMYYYISF